MEEEKGSRHMQRQTEAFLAAQVMQRSGQRPQARGPVGEQKKTWREAFNRSSVSERVAGVG